MKWYHKLTKSDLSQEEREEGLVEGLTKIRDEEFKSKWRKELTNKYGVLRTRRTRKIKNFSSWPIAIAASVVFLVGAYLLWHNQKTSYQLANDYMLEWDDVSNPHLMRKAIKPIDHKRNEANLASAEGNFEKSIEIYEEIISVEGTMWDHYYLGIAYLKDDVSNLEKSKAELKKALNMKGPNEEINWLLSLIFVMNQQNDSACISLQQMIEWDRYKVAESQSLIEHLRKEGHQCY